MALIQGRECEDTGTLLRTDGKVTAVFMLSLLGVLLLTFSLARTLGLHLIAP